MALEPGLLGLPNKTRREIEKVFDETKARLQEKKSWVTTIQAMQAHFVAIFHNLLLPLEDWHQKQGVKTPPKISAAKIGWINRKVT